MNKLVLISFGILLIANIIVSVKAINTKNEIPKEFCLNDRLYTLAKDKRTLVPVFNKQGRVLCNEE